MDAKLVAVLGAADKTTVYLPPGERFIGATMGMFSDTKLIGLKEKEEAHLRVRSELFKGIKVLRAD